MTKDIGNILKMIDELSYSSKIQKNNEYTELTEKKTKILQRLLVEGHINSEELNILSKDLISDINIEL